MPEYWLTIARDYLMDQEVLDKVIDHHCEAFAAHLAEFAAEFLGELPQREADHDEMLRDAYENQRLAEARGK